MLPCSMCPDDSVVPDSSTGQSLVDPSVVGPRLSPWMPTRRAVTMMECNVLDTGEDHSYWYQVACGITGKQTGEARWPLIAHLGE